MRVTFLGSGTSTGVPVVGCSCSVCRSTDSRNVRLRQSALVELDGKVILIDTTPDLRTQLLRFPVDWIDCILFTHAHADHIMGLDDVRPFNFFHRKPIVAFANHWTAAGIRRAFSYIWADTQPGGGKPQIDLRVVEAAFDHEGISVTPIPVTHGRWEIFGYRIGDFAYITDTDGIPEASRALLEGLEVLALDGLRPGPPHPTHFTIPQAIDVALEIGAKQTWLMHLSHDVDHGVVESTLPETLRLAYDGLVLEIA
ncbi:MAG: MBL fold metallo-hydrolase [Acidobacteria bacterium]|nr:MBL fold metallo-hydrolase [Acidobacteriota bacterium]